MIMQNKLHTISGLSGDTPFSLECSFLTSTHPSINLLDFSQRYMPDNSKPILVRFLHNSFNSIIDCSMFSACKIFSIKNKGDLGQVYVVTGNSNFSIATQQKYLLVVPSSYPRLFNEISSLQFDVHCFNPYKQCTTNELIDAYNKDLHKHGFVSTRIAFKLLLNEAFVFSKLDLSSVFDVDDSGFITPRKKTEIMLNENGNGLIFSNHE